MNFNWQCTEDRVVVEPIEEDDVTPGGIALPWVAKEKPVRGRVIAVGPPRQLDSGFRTEVPFGVGDEVLFGRYSGMEFVIPGLEKKLLVMRQNEVSLYRTSS